jgi:hypothetical protein
MAIDLSLIAMGLTALIGIVGAAFGLQFQGRYGKAVEAMKETATLLSLISITLAGISDAMKDQVLTQEEIEAVRQDLIKIKTTLEELQAGLLG